MVALPSSAIYYRPFDGDDSSWTLSESGELSALEPGAYEVKCIGASASQYLQVPEPDYIPRIATSNGNLLPYTYTDSSNDRSYRKRRRVNDFSDYRNIQLSHSNFFVSPGFESVSGLSAFTLSGYIVYNGVYYQMKWGGNTSVSVAPGSSVKCDPIPGLTIPAGEFFYEQIYVTGNVNERWLYSCSSNVLSGEGILTGEKIAQGSFGEGCLLTPTVVDNEITALSIDAAGADYSTAASIIAWQEEDDGTITSQSIGYTTSFDENDGIDGTFISNGDGQTWLDGRVNIVVSGGGGYGASTLIYSASLITGEALTADAPSMLLVADSNGRGQSSSDSAGDRQGNFGFIERGINGRFGIGSFAISGQSLSGFLQNRTMQMDLYDGVEITDLIIQSGGNDIGNGRTLVQIESNIAAIQALFDCDRYACVTVKPRTDSTDNWVTVANQTPTNTGYEEGDIRDQLNTKIRNGDYAVSGKDYYYVDPDKIVRDPTTTDAWAEEDVNGNTLRWTGDGIHFGGTDGLGLINVSTYTRGAYTHLEGIGGSITNVAGLDLVMGIEVGLSGLNNIINFPADGEEKSAYDWGLGDLAGSNEPVFVAATELEPAHYLFEGTDVLQMLNSTAFIDRLGRTDLNDDFWFAFFGVLNEGDNSNQSVFYTADTSDPAEKGISITTGYNFMWTRQNGDTDSGDVNASSNPAGVGLHDTAIIVSRRASDGEHLRRHNELESTSAWAYNDCVNNRVSSLNPLIGGKSVSTWRLLNGCKIYSAYMGRGYLSTDKADEVIAAAEAAYVTRDFTP